MSYTHKELRDMFPDNKLNLEKLAEEAAEVIQAKSKIIFFGLKDVYNNTKDHPDQSNVEKLEEEIGHFQAVVDVLIANGIVRPEKIEEAKPAKWDKMFKWNQYAGTKGDF
ncbi:MAG: SDR family oxidoreductase [Deltaproteobacteria bacterium]|nr:SDR family oxidoreductase [Deltaproteobacteria bacterium]